MRSQKAIDDVPLFPAILLSLAPVVIIAGIAAWNSHHVRFWHWRKWVRSLPEHRRKEKV